MNMNENKLNNLLLDYQDKNIDFIVNQLGYNTLDEAITDSNFVTKVNAFVEDYKYDDIDNDIKKDRKDSIYK